MQAIETKERQAHAGNGIRIGLSMPTRTVLIRSSQHRARVRRALLRAIEQDKQAIAALQRRVAHLQSWVDRYPCKGV